MSRAVSEEARTVAAAAESLKPTRASSVPGGFPAPVAARGVYRSSRGRSRWRSHVARSARSDGLGYASSMRLSRPAVAALVFAGWTVVGLYFGTQARYNPAYDQHVGWSRAI